MLKSLRRADLDRLLAAIANDYQLLTPQLTPGGSRLLLPHGAGELSLQGAPVQRKPTAAFFPQQEELLRLAADGTGRLPAGADRPIALFGLDAADLAGLAFVDRFFAAPPQDDVYLRRRQGALIIALTGAAGPDGKLLPPVTGGCDLQLVTLATGGEWLGQPFTEEGERWLRGFPVAGQPLPPAWNSLPKTASLSLLEKAADILRDRVIPEEFWAEIALRCIACGGCNFSCPTCTCFCLQDRAANGEVSRSRVWDSCQLDAFMREASGHNPLGTAAQRTRRRILHKLLFDPRRWGESGCVACGRCDRACPTGIGMFAVAEELLARFGANP